MKKVKSILFLILIIFLTDAMSVKSEYIQTANVAEREIKKYWDDDPEMRTAKWQLFMKRFCNFEPYITQVFYADQLFKNNFNVIVAPPRAGKTNGVAGVHLYDNYQRARQDFVIYVPKQEQGKESLAYQVEWINSSKLLYAYLHREKGKPQLSSLSYKLMNKSNARIKSIKGEIEGHNMSWGHFEEFDSWPWEKFEDVLRRGGAKNKDDSATRITVSGVILGQENIYRLMTAKEFLEKFNFAHKMPDGELIDVYYCLAAGILDPEFVEFQKISMSPQKWLMNFCLQFVTAKNFIHYKYILANQKRMLMMNGTHVPYLKNNPPYRSQGIVAAGFDCGHAGEKAESSCYSLQILEQVGTYQRWLNGFQWSPNIDTSKLEKEVLEILDWYGVQGGYGDALKHNMIASINDKAFEDGITQNDRSEYPEHTPANWEEWWLSPIWNNGKNKFLFFDALQQSIHNYTFFFPFVDEKDDTPDAVMIKEVIEQLINLREEQTQGSYPRYYGANPKLGDDHADSLGMASLWLATHFEPPINYSLLNASGPDYIMSGL